MPFSAPCVSSCVVLRDATLSSSKPLTLVAAGTEKETGRGQTLETHHILVRAQFWDTSLSHC